jgi:hypothetical protein
VFELGIILTAEFILEGSDFFYNFSDSEYLNWLPWKPAFATNILQRQNMNMTKKGTGITFS